MSPARIGGSILLLVLSAAAQALTSQHDLLLDLDNNPSTGCTVTTPDGPFNGVEAILSTEVETVGLSAADVVAVSRSECVDAATDTFGPAVNVGGGWPVGVGEGIAGFHAIETTTELAREYLFRDTRVGVVASNELGDSATLLQSGGASIILRGLPPLPIPIATAVGLALLALTLLALGLLVLGRRGRLTFTAVALLVGGGSAAAGAVYSGALANWGPEDVLAETAAADPEDGVEVRALLGQRGNDGSSVFFRIDSALVFAALPQPQADSYTTELTSAVNQGASTGLLSNDERGLPAADLVSFGGGDLSASVVDHAAGATVAIGADGSLTVNADGSFDFQAESGFDGPFSFDYRLENVAGAADATVTIDVQRPPAALDDAFDVLSGETLDTGSGALLANDTGWPAPQVAAFGGGDLGGSVDDNAAGGSVTVGADGTLTVNADGQAVFTPASGFTGVFMFDYRIDNPAGTDTATVTVTVNEAPTITSADSFSCSVGSACDFPFAAEGFPAPTITVAGTLPAGVTFNAGAESLEGTPQDGSGAVYTLTVTAANGIGADAQQTFALTVNEAPTITSADSLGCEIGEPCDFTATADGHPAATFSLPGLPAGLSLNATTGVIAGQPDAGTGGEYNLVLEATNSEGSDTQNFTLTIGQPPAITSPETLDCEVGQGCSLTLTADGFPVPTFAVDGTLPAGVTFDGTDLISGTPQAGSGAVYTLTVTATNGIVPDDVQTLTLTVNEAPTITSANAATCQTGQACNVQFTADGYPAPGFSLTGALPAGVSFDAGTGSLSGTPGPAAGGDYVLELTAANGVAPDDTQTFTLTVEQPPTITSAGSLTCETGSACSFTATADGYPAPTFSLPGLPAGLSFDGASGAISGTPDAGTGGVYNLTLTADNGVAPAAVQGFELTVNEAPTITSADALGCEVGVACSFTVTADGHPDPTFTLPGLPAGLNLDGASGIISGTPDAGTGGVYNLTLTAGNGIAPDATQSFALTVEQAPVITSAGSLTCEAGSACSFTATADGYPAPTFSLPGLPAGLSFDGVSGALSGVPDAATGGVYNLTLTAANGVNPDATQNFELTVNEAPAITSAPATTCQAGQPCAFTFTANGFPDPIFGIAEALPAGLSLNTASGQLSGTPAAGTGGEYVLTVEADNGINPAATQSFTLTIGEAPAITSADSVTCEVGASCSFGFSATGYPDPDILVSGSMPSGVTFDAVTDSLTGIPDVGAGGVYTLDVEAANGFAPNAAQTFTLTVNEAPQAVDDPTGGIPAGSSPGSMPYHGSLDTTLVVNAAAGVLANDQLGYPVASIESLTTTSNAGGAVTLTGDGGFSYQPPTGFTGIDAFTYCLDNGVVTPPCAIVEVAVGERPSASDDTFAETLVGNTDIDTARSSGYSLYALAGGDEITVTLVAATNGDALVNSTTGTFSFDPAAGFNGSATLEYQVSNGFAETPTGTVTFTVDDMIWYYDNTAAAGGDGRLSSPFDSLAGASASAAGDIHFVYAGSGEYAGGIGLLDGQVLIGQAAAGTLGGFLTPPVPADSVLPTAGARPVIANAAGAGVTLGLNNILRGFNVGATTGFGLLGNNFGSLDVADVSITGSGSGLSLDTGSVTGAGFDQVNATLGSHGIVLTAVNGNVVLGNGAVSGATTAALELNGGSANVSFGGSLQPGAGGRPLLVQNKSGGLVELTGAVSSTALGVRVANNSATTTRLAGGLNLVTGSNPAFQASAGGVVEVCDDNPCDPGVVGGLVNTLSTTTGVALDVANTTIGGNNLEFRSISAGTAASGPASGIVLDTTGGLGGLKVRGTGSAGSGGTIQNSTASGIVLIDTDIVELASMTVTGNAAHGIDGTLVAGFELVDVDVTANGDAVNEEGINFVNLSGDVSMVDVVATGNAYHNLRIDNDSGTISSLAISGGSFSNNDPVLGNHGILITPRGSSVISSAFVEGVTLSGNLVMGMQVATADSASVNSFVVANSTFEGNELGLDFSKAQTSSIAFDIDSNVFTGQNSHGLNVFTAVGAGTTGSLSGIIRNNSVGQEGVDGSGSVIGNCMRVNINGDTDAAVRVDNNILRECPNGRGLEVIGRNGIGSLDVTVVNNDIDHVNLGFDPGTSDFPLAAIMVQSNCATVCNTVRSDVRNNVVPAGTAFDFTGGFVTLVQSNASVLQLVDTAPASADCAAQLTSTNTGSVGVAGTCTLIAGPIDAP